MNKKKVKIISFLLAINMLLMLILQLTFNQVFAAPQPFAFYTEDLNSGSPIVLSGQAFYSGGDLYLTNATGGQVGAAFSLQKIEETNGFSTFFQLSTNSGTNPPADGFAIILAKDTNIINYSDLFGQNLGYGNIGASVGIEIDMYRNNEPEIPHMYLWTRSGNVPPESGSHGESGTTHLDRNLVMNGDFYVWVEYSNQTHVINVFISKTDTKPSSPVATYYIDLGSVIGNSYYVGISASTGTFMQNHIVKAWGWGNTSEFSKSSNLSVNPNGGTWEGSTGIQNFEINCNATKNIPVPTRTGYTFTGWTLTGQGSTMSSLTGNSTFTMGTEDATLTANWSPISYQVDYHGNGATSGSMTTSTHIFDQEKNLSKNQYQRIYKVSYDFNGGEQASYQEDAVATFNGWANTTTGDVVFTDQAIVKNLRDTPGVYDVYANWTLASVILPSPTRTGFNLLGWDTNKDAEQATYPAGSTYTPTQDTTLYSIWEPYSLKARVNIKDKETKNIIQNDAILEVYEWNKDTGEYTKKTELVRQPDNSYLTEDYLEYTPENEGKYRIIETTAPQGYYGDWQDETQKNVYDFNILTIIEQGQYQDQTVTDKGTILIEIENQRVKANIDVTVVDDETKAGPQADAVLDGAEFGLYAKDDIIHADGLTGTLYNQGELIQRQTVVDGKLQFTGLELGNYTIKQIAESEGYLLNQNSYDVELPYEGEDKAIVTRQQTIEQTVKKQAFQILKLGGVETDPELEALAGAGFKIYLISDLSRVKSGEIKPNANGSYNLEDFYGYDFTNEQTALDFSNSTEGEPIAEIFTGEDGMILSPELAYGKYVVYESTVPDEHLSINPFLVTITEDSRKPQTLRTFLDRDFTARIRVIKKDSTTHETVLKPNAKYRILNKETNEYVEQTTVYPIITKIGTEENPYTTNSQGYFITPLELKPGEYELQEVQAPEGYVRTGYEGTYIQGVEQSTPKENVTFKVTQHGIFESDPDTGYFMIEVEQYNEQQLGSLKVTSQGEYLVGTEETETGITPVYETKPIENVKLELYAKEDIYSQDGQGQILYNAGEKVAEGYTNQEGIIYFDELPLGSYTVKQTEVPEGFVLNEEEKQVDFEYAGDQQSVVKQEILFENDRQKVNLTNDNGLKIDKEAEKKVYEQGEKIVYNITIKNQSENQINNISVKESKLNGYFQFEQTDRITTITNNEIRINTLAPGEKLQVQYIMNSAEIEKDKQKIENLVQAEGTMIIQTEDEDGNPITEEKQVTDEDTEVVVVTNKELVVIKEAVQPKYESGDTVIYSIQVINNSNNTIENIVLSDTLGGTFVGINEVQEENADLLQITKQEDNTLLINRLLAGEKVVLQYEYTIPESQEENTTITNYVNVTGNIIKQTEDEDGNIIEETEEITDEDSEDIEVIKQTDESYIGIVKKDIDTHQPVQGAVLGIYAKEDILDKDGNILIPQGTLMQSAETDSLGRAKYTIDLPLGNYEIREISAPEGYMLNTEAIPLDATYRGQETSIIYVSQTFVNKAYSVDIIKTDMQGNRIADATLQIIDGQGNVIVQWNSITEAPEKISKLESNVVYTLQEIQPAQGYVTAEPIQFKISENNEIYVIKDGIEEKVTTIQMKDDVTKVSIDIVDIDTGEDITSGKLQIVDKETGEVVYETEITGETIEIEKIPIGDYELVIEEVNEDGYLNKTQDLTILDTPEVQENVVELEYTKLQIQYIDEETKEQIPGGKLQIIDQNGNIVLEIETAEDAALIEKLPPGDYILREVETASGYESTEDISFTLEETPDLQNITIIKKRKPFDLQVEKYISNINIDGEDTVTNNYENKDKLLKVEIPESKVNTMNIVITYKIRVSNLGQIDGTVGSIVEQIPDGFEFITAENPDWTLEEGKIVCNKWRETSIEAGKYQECEIKLHWINNNNNFGVRTNYIQMLNINNEYNFEDINTDNNDAESNIVFSVKTGGINTTFIWSSVLSVMLVTLGITICVMVNRRK